MDKTIAQLKITLWHIDKQTGVATVGLSVHELISGKKLLDIVTLCVEEGGSIALDNTQLDTRR